MERAVTYLPNIFIFLEADVLSGWLGGRLFRIVHDGNFRIMLLQGLPIIDESIRKGLTQSETYTDLALIMDLVSVNKINSKYLRLAFEIMDTVNSKRTRKSFNSGFFRALRELAVWHASSGGFTN